MEIKGVEIAKIKVTFSLDDDELDKLSLALSICEAMPKNDAESEAVNVLLQFSKILNEMLDRVKKED